MTDLDELEQLADKANPEAMPWRRPGDQTLIDAVPALIARLRAAETERDSFVGWGWLDDLGKPHKGCPPLTEPDGWVTLYSRQQ